MQHLQFEVYHLARSLDAAGMNSPDGPPRRLLIVDDISPGIIVPRVEDLFGRAREQFGKILTTLERPLEITCVDNVDDAFDHYRRNVGTIVPPATCLLDLQLEDGKLGTDLLRLSQQAGLFFPITIFSGVNASHLHSTVIRALGATRGELFLRALPLEFVYKEAGRNGSDLVFATLRVEHAFQAGLMRILEDIIREITVAERNERTRSAVGKTTPYEPVTSMPEAVEAARISAEIKMSFLNMVSRFIQLFGDRPELVASEQSSPKITAQVQSLLKRYHRIPEKMRVLSDAELLRLSQPMSFAEFMELVALPFHYPLAIETEQAGLSYVFYLDPDVVKCPLAYRGQGQEIGHMLARGNEILVLLDLARGWYAKKGDAVYDEIGKFIEEARAESIRLREQFFAASEQVSMRINPELADAWTSMEVLLHRLQSISEEVRFDPVDLQRIYGQHMQIPSKLFEILAEEIRKNAAQHGTVPSGKRPLHCVDMRIITPGQSGTEESLPTESAINPPTLPNNYLEVTFRNHSGGFYTDGLKDYKYFFPGPKAGALAEPDAMGGIGLPTMALLLARLPGDSKPGIAIGNDAEGIGFTRLRLPVILSEEMSSKALV